MGIPGGFCGITPPGTQTVLGPTVRRPPTSPLPVGQVFEISFASFTPRITIHSERELTVEIIAGDNVGFSETVEYETTEVRDGPVILSWQEHIGSTIVHVLDLTSGEAYTAVTPAKGGRVHTTDGSD
jgi:hypothetical protein